MESSPSALTRDYYDVLGVGRQATKAELKRAYRRLALRYHPDRNPGSAEAAARFREVMEAYAVLSNPIRRWHYDHRSEHFSAYAEGGRTGRRPGWKRPATWAGLGLGLAVVLALGSYFALQAGGSDGRVGRAMSYVTVVARADSLFEVGAYREALTGYFEARELQPTTHVLIRINEATDRVVAQAQGRLPATLVQGDSLVPGGLLARPEGLGEEPEVVARYGEAREARLVALEEDLGGGDSLAGRVDRLAEQVEQLAEQMREVLASGTGTAVDGQASGEQSSADAATAEMQRQLLFIVHSQQGDILLLEGKPVEARAKYEEALAYRPGDAYLLSRIEQIGEEVGVPAMEEGARSISTLARLTPVASAVEPVLARPSLDDRATEWQYRHFRARGDTAMAKGDYQAAVNNYQSALASKPDDAPVAERLAEARAALQE